MCSPFLSSEAIRLSRIGRSEGNGSRSGSVVAGDDSQSLVGDEWLTAVLATIQPTQKGTDRAGKDDWDFFVGQMASTRNDHKRSMVIALRQPLSAPQADGAIAIAPQQECRYLPDLGQHRVQSLHLLLPAVEDAQDIGDGPRDAQGGNIPL